jgi:hypothetical protein
MTMGDGGTAPLATLSPAPQARHFGGGAGFVNENELAGVQVGLPFEPTLACCLHVRALLFTRMRRLFLYVMSRLSKNSQTVEGAAETPYSVKS